MTNDELLLRIAQTLKQEIGPTVADEYAKTQAFMAAVVLEKIGRECACASAHAAAHAAELAALVVDLDATLALDVIPAAVGAALQAVRTDRDQAALCRLIETFYATRPELGEARFEILLGRVRQALRANIDRRMEYAA